MTCFWLFAQENSNTFMSPTFLVFGGVLYQHQPFDVEPNEPTNLESSCLSSLFTSWRRWISQKCSNSNRSNSKTCDNGNVWKSETIENRPAHKPRYPVDIQSLLPWFPPMSHITTNSSNLHSLNKLQKGPQVLQKTTPMSLIIAVQMDLRALQRHLTHRNLLSNHVKRPHSGLYEVAVLGALCLPIHLGPETVGAWHQETNMNPNARWQMVLDVTGLLSL